MIVMLVVFCVCVELVVFALSKDTIRGDGERVGSVRTTERHRLRCRSVCRQGGRCACAILASIGRLYRGRCALALKGTNTVYPCRARLSHFLALDGAGLAVAEDEDFTR